MFGFLKKHKKMSSLLVDGDVCDVFLGLPRNGKTLTLNEDIVLPFLLAGYNVYTSYWENWNLPNWHYFKDLHEITDVRNCIVVIDETGRILDPRDYSSEDRSIRDFFIYHGHNHVDIYMSAQDLDLVAKTMKQIVDRYFWTERIYNTPLQKFIFGRKNIYIETTEMTVSDLKKMQMVTFDNDDDSVPTFALAGSQKTKYRISNLSHPELNEFKQELVYWYCPRCNSRQLYQIPAAETNNYGYFEKNNFITTLKKTPLCPKHQDTHLFLKPSPMYDSDYLPPTIDVPKLIFKPYYRTEAVLPYKGSLTPEQQSLKRQLEFGD